MFRPLESFIGLRYLRSRRRRGVVSFMSLASMLGITLGVAALIVILSVMNGLESEFRTRLLALTEHVSVRASESAVGNWRNLQNRILAEDDVLAVSPFVQLEAMLSAGSQLRPALVRGIVPHEEAKASEIAEIVGEATLAELVAGEKRVLLGRFLALNLGVTVGESVNLLIPSVTAGRPGLQQGSFTVAGIFYAGAENHDANLALTHLEDAAGLIGLDGQPQGLAVRLIDPMLAQPFQRFLSDEIGSGYRYSNWADDNRSLFRAMAIEKTMMTIILMLIVAVAAFNIVASLMMVVNEKEKDIAILRTYGLAPKRVVRIFFVQGAFIGLIGTILGTVLGLVMAANVETIVPWLEAKFNFKIMPGDVFYVTEIPSEIQFADVTMIALFAILITILATIFPSRRAALVEPATALRYE